MGFLDDISSALQAGVDFTMKDAILITAGAKVKNDRGSHVAADITTPCRAKLDLREKTDGAGGVVYQTRIIILAGSITSPPVENSLLQFEVDAFDADEPSYKIGKHRMDGIASHYVCEVIDG